MKRLLLVIPAYNEEKSIAKVLHNLPRRLPSVSSIDTLVVDDGSTDNTLKEAGKHASRVLHHTLNRGLGGALGTGFEYAKRHTYDFVITFDADGQHHPSDLKKILSPLVKNRADVVVGSRLLKKTSMPPLRQIVNKLSNIVTYILFGVWISDSQSGLRGFSRSAIERIHIRSQGMEVSSEIFKEVGRLKLRVVEVPVKTIYTNYSLTKGQRISNAPNVVWKLVLHRFI